jgi:Protein of unknown function (DUF5818)
MRFLRPGSTRPLARLCFVLLACACAAAMQDQQTQPSQTAPGAEQRRAGGSKSITGCLLKGDTGFVVKTQEGTYQLNTDRDLTAFVGKTVRIESKWDASGTLTNSPMESSSAAGSSGPASPATDAGTPAFVGDLHLHITGTVLGDCATEK